MVLHSIIVQLAAVAWKFIALADSFILEKIPKKYSSRLRCKAVYIVTYVPTFRKSFQPSTSSVLDYSKGAVGLTLRHIVSYTPIYTASCTRRLGSSSLALVEPEL